MRRLVAAALALFFLEAYASTQPYVLELPANDAAFRIDFDVDHPGSVVVEAEWEGPRVLSFRIEARATSEGTSERISEGTLEEPVIVRRSGPSPQRVTLELGPDRFGHGPWSCTLSFRALPAMEHATGTLRLILPDPPEVVARREAAARPPPPPPPAPPSWMLPHRAPAGVSARTLRVLEAVEGLRRRLVVEGPALRPDSCGWQEALLVSATGWRDTHAGGATPTIEPGLLVSMAAGIEAVEALRTSSDPLLAGPLPDPGLRRRAWMSVRDERLRPLVAELDALTAEAARTHAHAGWPAALVSCLTACQRHFEERVRLGEDAAHGDLVKEQWDALRDAAALFRALASP